ncbi:MAG: histidine kinase, partial [Bacteroidetes bacterium]|nr:histidine kinase [Bacteroidota bacterium]
MKFKNIFPAVYFLISLNAALLCIPDVSKCQAPIFEEVPFTFRNSDVRISKILKDKDGWLYFGTDHGLFRFDGIRFSKIICADTLKDESVSTLFQTMDGKIWVGFRNGAIASYFKRKFAAFKPEEGLPKVSISAFEETTSGSLWISTNGEGIYIVSGKHLYNINSDDGLNDNYVHALHSLNNTDIIIAASDQGLNECTFNNGKKSVRNISPVPGLPDNIITGFLENKNNIIAGTQDKGICIIDQEWKNLLIPEVSRNWSYGMVNKVISVGDEYWIATNDHGLVIADTADGKMRFNLKKGNLFQHSAINDLVSDNEGNVLLACNDGILKSPGKKIRLIESLQNEKISFVHATLFDSHGNCWFSPDQGLIKMWTDTSGNIHRQKFTLTPPEKLIDIVTLYEDPYGFLWIGTMGAGIFRLQISTGAVKKITENPALTNGSILTISGKADDVWIGGFEGTILINLKNNVKGSPEIKFADNIVTDSLRNCYVYCIYTDKENRTWFGTDGDGAYMYDGRLLKNVSSTEFNAHTVYSIAEDGSGNIWFNTQDNGLFKFNGKHFQNFSINDGLSDANISSMIFDHSGNLILTHKNGIDILNKKEIRFTYLRNNRELSNMNPDLNSASVNTDGVVYIGTEKFILQLSPDELAAQPFPKTFIDNISVFQKEVGDSIHSFASDQNNISFDFTGLWYADPTLVQYQYKLDGFNDEWINTTDREITFPKLSPGTYTFNVRSSLNSDFSNASEASFRFDIRAPFWKTNWFQIISSLSIAFLLYLFIRYRDRRIRNIDRLKKEAIEFQFEMLKSQVNPHFLFNSFNTLIAIIEEDQKTAVSYVEKLSEFFRSIVAYRDKNLIPLREEINLLNNYFFLQKKRYGQHLSLNIKIDDNTLSATQIPPLTLQLLVENAIKHNAVSKESPMEIGIFIESSNIIVVNNINPKLLSERSSGMGLQNIT